MSNIPSHALVFLIGGGVIGCSVAYFLDKAGQGEVVSIGLGMLRADLALAGTEIDGEKVKAVVQEDAPLWDPENERIRA